AELSECRSSSMESTSYQVAELEAENIRLKKEKTECYLDYLDQEKNRINVKLLYKFYKELTLRQIEINVLQEKVHDLEKQVISRNTIIFENESNVDVIPTQSFMNLEDENKQLVEQVLEQNKRITRILRVKEVKLSLINFETVIQKYEEAVYNYLGYKFKVSDNNDIHLILVKDDSDSDM
ncbi:11489_t:CDS:2, partial [Dentiscutata heterogama]